jgi:hypothetical protein
MLRTETVEAGTLDLIKRFMSDNYLNEFNLVGGTALALKIGHRMSVDIDLFSSAPFNSSELGHHLTTTYQATEVRVIKNGVFCFVNNIKIDILTHQYPLVENINLIDGVRMVSLLDIGAMKLNAIFNSGKRLKDFVDMYALLEIHPLNDLLDACCRKYADLNINMVKNSLLFHDDIIFTPIEYIGSEINWSEIAERLQNSYHNPHTTFGLPETTKKLMKKILADEKRKNRGRKL